MNINWKFITVFIGIPFLLLSAIWIIMSTGSEVSEQNAPEIAETKKEEKNDQTTAENNEESTIIQTERNSVIQLEDTAKNYCDKRKKASRSYPIVDLQEGTSGNIEAVPETYRVGNQLSLEDCYKAITYLTFIGRESNIDNIANQIRWVGMDNIDLLFTAGVPDDVNSTTSSWGTTEQWVYQGGGYHTMYIYLDNKKVTSWQDF